MVSADVTCTVCGDTVDESLASICGVCDLPFHLNPRNDVPGKDCGETWIDEQFLSLRFACARCLGGSSADAEGGEPPVGKGH